MKKQSTSVVILCMVSFIQAYLLVNIFPYQAYLSVYMWNRQHPERSITVEQAGPYAAFLTSAFMIGRTLTAHYWGRFADIYGRRVAIISSLIGSGWACLWFGMTSTYGGWLGAVAARGVIGGWNSIVGITKTLATELAYYDFDNEGHAHDVNDEQCKQETRIVGLVMSMRAWGFLIAPAIAGFLADPLLVRENNNDTFPNTLIFQMLQSYPYLLPNLLGVILCWFTAIAVFSFVPETLEDCKPLSCDHVHRKSRLDCKTRKPTAYVNGTYGSLEDIVNDDDEDMDNSNCCWHKTKEESETSIASIWSRKNTRNHLIAYWLYSFAIIAIDEAFPLYCISNKNGLGRQLSETEIGTILSLAGLFFAVGQFHAYTWIVDRFGIYGSLSLGCWWGILPVSFIPTAALVDIQVANQIGITMYIALLIGVAKIFQSTFFSSITVTTNRTVPKNVRSSMNGFGGMGAGGAKALGPILAGYWMSLCISQVHHGITIAFIGFAFLSLPIYVNLQFLERSEQRDANTVTYQVVRNS